MPDWWVKPTEVPETPKLLLNSVQAAKALMISPRML